MKKCKVLLLSLLIFMLAISFAFAQNIEKGLEKVREYNTALDLFLQRDDFTNVIKDFKTEKAKGNLRSDNPISGIVIDELFLFTNNLSKRHIM